MSTSPRSLYLVLFSVSIILEASSLTFQLIVLKLSPLLGLSTVTILMAEIVLHMISRRSLALGVHGLRSCGHFLNAGIFAAGFVACTKLSVLCSACRKVTPPSPIQSCEALCTHTSLERLYMWAIPLYATIALSESTILFILRRSLN